MAVWSELHCDSPRCYVQFEYASGWLAVDGLRRAAHNKGWTHVMIARSPTLDYCPSCSEKSKKLP